MRFNIALALVVILGFAAGYAQPGRSSAAEDMATSEESAIPAWRDPQDAVYRVTESEAAVDPSAQAPVRL